MLVITRAVEERIMIGSDVVITLVAIRGGRCRIGIEAPKHIPVHRQEVFDAIQRANREASDGSPD